MEQNLSDRERKQRLVLGILAFSAGAVVLFLENVTNLLGYGLFILGVGLMVNYVTCFCGTKKAIASVRQKIGR